MENNDNYLLNLIKEKKDNIAFRKSMPNKIIQTDHFPIDWFYKSMARSFNTINKKTEQSYEEK